MGGFFVFKIMAKLRSINTEFWADEYIGELSRDEKLLFLYFLTNPLTNIAGAYKIAQRVIKQDTGFSDAELDALLLKFDQDEKVFYYDGWLFLPNFLKNQSLNGNMRTCALNQALDAPAWIQGRIRETIEKSAKLTAEFGTLRNVVLTLKTSRESTSPNRRGIEGEDEFKTPLSPEQSPEGETGDAPKPKNLKPRSLPTSLESEINSWLDAVAPLTGAKNRQTMASPKSWRDAVEKAIAEEWGILDFLAVTRSEAQRNKSSPQYFTPTNVLKVLQSKKVKPNNGFIH